VEGVFDVALDQGGFADAWMVLVWKVLGGGGLDGGEGLPCAPRTTILASREELMAGWSGWERRRGEFAWSCDRLGVWRREVGVGVDVDVDVKVDVERERECGGNERGGTREAQSADLIDESYPLRVGQTVSCICRIGYRRELQCDSWSIEYITVHCRFMNNFIVTVIVYPMTSSSMQQAKQWTMNTHTEQRTNKTTILASPSIDHR
jgi:hypothetical protein